MPRCVHGARDYGERMVVLALAAIFPAVATPFFFVFWQWFDVWRRHQAAIACVLVATVASWVAALIVWRAWWLASVIALPAAAHVVGWTIAAASFVLSVVADRQLGLRVRAGLPLLDGERIRLRTRGAYAVVRHPIYAAGIYYQVGMFLVTGMVAIAVAGVVLTLGALWFTRTLRRAIRTAPLSMSLALTLWRSNLAAAIARMPVPVPISSGRRNFRRLTRSSRASRQALVEACSPVPKAAVASSAKPIAPAGTRPR